VSTDGGYDATPGGIIVFKGKSALEPLKPAFPDRCGCGAAWAHMPDGICSTCVGYFSPTGHDHDDNCTTRQIICASGHKKTIGLRRSCGACDWRGKTQCCGDFAYVDEWPVLP
jgi:hypothetical protein